MSSNKIWKQWGGRTVTENTVYKTETGNQWFYFRDAAIISLTLGRQGDGLQIDIISGDLSYSSSGVSGFFKSIDSVVLSISSFIEPANRKVGDTSIKA